MKTNKQTPEDEKIMNDIIIQINKMKQNQKDFIKAIDKFFIESNSSAKVHSLITVFRTMF